MASSAGPVAGDIHRHLHHHRGLDEGDVQDVARRRKAHSSRRIRVELGIGHLKNWRSLARHHGRREHMSDIIQAVAGLLSHQQAATMASGTRT
ncbi:hypothetical protein ACFVZC_36005 [Streptomyces marokkonensis]|uniref:Transposase n=1 Tax=Streptomyces marokkonensis TaxID=324855 RepID=A0ABW6QHL7_9ACTN